jgi:hypothetical protein
MAGASGDKRVATMTAGATDTTAATEPAERPLSLVFLAIVVVELAAIAALYWAGAHFSA